jgi:hypothetical protein
MLNALSALRGCAIESHDGPLGSVKDFLFDDRSWKLRWLLVETGNWLAERNVLLHPSVVAQIDHVPREISVNLTRAQVEYSPAIERNRPVSQQTERRLYTYYNWEPTWSGGSYFDTGALPLPVEESQDNAIGDPHLRSTQAITDYGLHATDGHIGYIEDFLLDDTDWGLRYLVVDTRTWWPGKHVLLSPYAITEVDWPSHQISVDVTRNQVRCGPKWNFTTANQAAETKLYFHCDWRGYSC